MVIKKVHPKIKSELHPKNKHRGRYNFDHLIQANKELAQYVKPNKYNDISIDFANPNAVKSLNKALLYHFYNIKDWDIPSGYLCPPIPGRADYIHHIVGFFYSLFNKKDFSNIPLNILDIGTGANCIYPLIGTQEYNCKFVATDIDPVSIENARIIIKNNPQLEEKIELRLQENKGFIFNRIIKKDEYFDLTICNPPFHKSFEEAQVGTYRKLKNISKNKPTKTVLNFGGKSNELWCKGGEERFIKNMINESKKFGYSCLWFSTLVSKQSNLSSVYQNLKFVEALNVKTLPMAQGNKSSRIVAWTFHSIKEHETWIKNKKQK